MHIGLLLTNRKDAPATFGCHGREIFDRQDRVRRFFAVPNMQTTAMRRSDQGLQ
jgi:hypothetical protein